MLVIYCLVHCLAVALNIGSEFMQVALGIFCMLSASTEKSASSITLQQTFALIGYTIFMSSKLLTNNTLIQEVALFVYFASICLSGASWHFFYPELSKLPDSICCSNGRYFIGDRKGKSVIVSGNFKFILLRFGDRLRGPLMKLVSTIKIYAASE